MAQVALAWSFSKPFVDAPIIGTTSLEKLEDLIKGCEVELTEEEIKGLMIVMSRKRLLGIPKKDKRLVIVLLRFDGDRSTVHFPLISTCV